MQTNYTASDNLDSARANKNYRVNPQQLIKQVFIQIHQQEMADLPFVNPALSVNCIGFELHEGNWLGVLITPWCMNLLMLPGPDREWSKPFTIGEKMGLTLGDKDYTFVAGEHHLLGQYLACSLCSPVSHFRTQAEAEQLALDVRRLIVAIPVTTLDDPSKRKLFSQLGTSAAR